MRRSASSLLLVALTLAGTACDRVKEAIRPGPSVDVRWQGDSSLLASNPDVLFQRYERQGQTRVVPWATIGKSGFRVLSFAPRGWRAFDLTYMHAGAELTVLRDGRAAGSATITRGMWEPTPLDSIPQCGNPIPAAAAELAPDVRLLLNKRPEPLRDVTALGGGELETILSTVPTLVVPTLGVAGSALSRYEREVHVIASGATARPTVVVIYNDPESLADSVAAIAQRPRQLVIALDRGVYGYRPSYTFKTVGNAKDNRRMRFKGSADVDGDGRAELLFGIAGTDADRRQFADLDLFTIVLRFENESWRELYRGGGARCAF